MPKLLFSSARIAFAAITLTGLAPGQPAPPAEDGQWTMPAKNFENTRYSGLDQIKIDNAKGLRVAWTFSVGVDRGQEAAPLVVGDTMYVVTSYPNILYALDLKKNGALKWKFESEPAAAAQGVACCDVVNRGCFFDKGKIFFNTLDDNVCAVDANSGKLLWKTKVGDINRGETMTMAPLVVHDKVLAETAAANSVCAAGSPLSTRTVEKSRGVRTAPARMPTA